MIPPGRGADMSLPAWEERKRAGSSPVAGVTYSSALATLASKSLSSPPLSLYSEPPLLNLPLPPRVPFPARRTTAVVFVLELEQQHAATSFRSNASSSIPASTAPAKASAATWLALASGDTGNPCASKRLRTSSARSEKLAVSAPRPPPPPFCSRSRNRRCPLSLSSSTTVCCFSRPSTATSACRLFTCAATASYFCFWAAASPALLPSERRFVFACVSSSSALFRAFSATSARHSKLLARRVRVCRSDSSASPRESAAKARFSASSQLLPAASGARSSSGPRSTSGDTD
mmetsp:Transcript_79/g.129  ORF Transcript_79/g.129 Transcript_79/m.129 type:complete len:290 (-) Transcript_79:427-1296(-)